MLKQPVHKLYEGATEGGEVANALVDLKMKVEELDPGKFDFEPGWVTRTIGRCRSWARRSSATSPRTRARRRSSTRSCARCANGREQLSRDNITLTDDQKAMRALTEKLEKAVKLGQMIDAKLAAKLERELAAGDPRRTFVESEWLFPLRQRIQDLQQQLVVNQQGVHGDRARSSATTWS